MPDVDRAEVGDDAKPSERLRRQFGVAAQAGLRHPPGRFIRALCHDYGVELQNFAPNAISQAAVFVAVCEGYLGILEHWDLWRHLFWGELYTESVLAGVRRPVGAGGLTLQLQGSRKDLYIPCKMTTNNSEWDRG